MFESKMCRGRKNAKHMVLKVTYGFHVGKIYHTWIRHGKCLKKFRNSSPIREKKRPNGFNLYLYVVLMNVQLQKRM